MRIAAIVFAFVFTCGGCTGITHIGNIGDVEFYEVHSEQLVGPNISTLVVKRGDKVSPIGIFASGGIAPSLVQAGGNIGSAAVFGHSLDPDENNISNDSSSDSKAKNSNSNNASNNNTNRNTNRNRNTNTNNNTARARQSQGQAQGQVLID